MWHAPFSPQLGVPPLNLHIPDVGVEENKKIRIRIPYRMSFIVPNRVFRDKEFKFRSLLGPERVNQKITHECFGSTLDDIQDPCALFGIGDQFGIFKLSPPQFEGTCPGRKGDINPRLV